MGARKSSPRLQAGEFFLVEAEFPACKRPFASRLLRQLLHALVHARRGPAGRDADQHPDQVRDSRDRRHGRNAEFHALTSCPAIPYAAAGANVQQIAEKDGLSILYVIKLDKQSKKSSI